MSAGSSQSNSEIAPGVRLEVSEESDPSVSARWVTGLEYPDAIAVHDGVVYVVADVFYALRLSDGTEIWSTGGDEYALGGSGGGEIGSRGTGAVRAWEPSEFGITVERSSGRVLSFERGVATLERGDLDPFPAPEPEHFQIDMDLEQIVARNQDGSLAWRIEVDEPIVDELPPIGVPGGLVLSTSSGHVVMLEYR